MAPSGKAAKSKILVSARDKGPAVKTDFNQNRLAKTKRYHSWCCAAVNREFGLLNLMNTPEHCSAPFHRVSSKVAKSTKMV